MNKYTLELTEEELNFIYDRCSNKAARLEDSNLEDTPCYRLAHQVMHKIYESKKEETKLRKAIEAWKTDPRPIVVFSEEESNNERINCL